MAEEYDDHVTVMHVMDICCPKCGSRNITVKCYGEKYFYVYECKDCGYKGEEGDSVGCNSDPLFN